MQRVGVIIPFYGGERYLPALLGSLAPTGAAVVLVDNGPRPVAAPTGAAVVIRTRPGIGYGRACNVGVAELVARGVEIGVILNQDTIAEPGAIEALADAIHDGAGTASPIELDYDGQAICAPFARNYIVAPLMFDAIVRGDTATTYPIEVPHGFCLAAPTELLSRFGPFDPLFHMYGEDNDLGQRLRAAGVTSVLVPGARVRHAHSNDTASGAERRRIERWQTRSGSVRILKDRGSMGGSLAYDLVRRIPRYARLIAAGNSSDIPGYLADQLDVYRKLPEIRKARAGQDVRERVRAALAADLDIGRP